MHIAVCPEKSILDERWICGSSDTVDSIPRRMIDDFRKTLVRSDVPMLKKKEKVRRVS